MIGMDTFESQEQKFLKRFFKSRRKYLSFGLALILIFLVILYLIPFGGLERFGFIAQKKGQEQPSSAASTVSPLIFGTNLALYDASDQFLTSAATRQQMKNIHISLVRMPIRSAGSADCSGSPTTWEVQAAQDIHDLGMIPMVILKFTQTDPAGAGKCVIEKMNSIFGSDVVYYEFGNERNDVIDAAGYTNSWNSVIAQLKQVALNGKFIGPVPSWPDTSYISYFVKNANPAPDYVSYHQYACSSSNTTSECLSKIPTYTTHLNEIKTAIAATGKPVPPIMLTEWNYDPVPPNPDPRVTASFEQQYTQAMFNELANAGFFAVTHYVVTGSGVYQLIDSSGNLTTQGQVFGQMYDSLIGSGTLPTPVPTPTTPPTPTPPTSNNYLWCEAEKSSLALPMVSGTDSTASNGTYIYSTVSNSTDVLPANTGTATLSFNIPETGTYTFWSRTNYGGEFQNSYLLQFDGGTLYKVGNENTGYGTWKWVDWYNGDVSTANIVKVSLTAGTHTLKIIGREASTKIDKFLLTTDAAYTPTGLGNADNCGGGDSILPTVTITAPTNGSTVSGVVNVTANATDNVGVTKVEFYTDSILKVSDTTTPYGFIWDTNVISVPNGPHTISAKAYDAAGNIDWDTISVIVQNGDTQAPTTPTGLAATAPAYNKVNLSWTASTDNVGVAGYWIVRGGVMIAYTTATTYSDTPVSPKTNYTYQIIAYDAAGNNSTPSTGVSVTTPDVPDTQAPAAPTNLAASAVSSSQINLSWTASTDNIGVTGYEVYRNSAKVATVTTTSYGDTGLSASTSYSYYVKAHDAAGNISASSNTVSATTLAVPVYGAITGTVTNSTGASISGASVVTTVAGVRKTATTNSSGVYSLVNLPAGTYSVKFSARGYTAQTISVTVTSGNPTTKNVILQAKGGKR